MEIQIFKADSLLHLESYVNNFGKLHDIVQISFSTEKHGYDTAYYCAVLYKV